METINDDLNEALDLAQIEQYMEHLFRDTPGQIEIRAIPVEGRVQSVFTTSRHEAAAKLSDLAQPGVNLYVGCATRRDSSSGKKTNLQSSSVLWVDLDNLNDPLDEGEVAQRLAGVPEPMLRVFSGGGLHLYWRLAEPLDLADPAGIERLERVIKGLCDAVGGDRAATDASRVLRIPGTINYPDTKKRAKGRVPAPAKILQITDRAHRLEDFERFERRGQELRSDARVEYERAEFTGELPSAVAELLAKHPRIKARFDRDNTGLEDASASEIDMSLAVLLAQRGISGASIEAALRCSRAFNNVPDKGDSYYTLTVENAIAYVQRNEANEDARRARERASREEAEDILQELIGAIGSNLDIAACLKDSDRLARLAEAADQAPTYWEAMLLELEEGRQLKLKRIHQLQAAVDRLRTARAKVAGGAGGARNPDEMIAEMNAQYAFVMHGGTSRILCERRNPETGAEEVLLFKPNGLRDFLSNQRVQIQGKQVEAFLVWRTSEKRRSYRGLVFKPGPNGEPVDEPGYYNLWKGFAVQPASRPRHCHLFLRHLRQNICQGDRKLYRWLIAWLAHAVQHPAEPSHTAIVLKGDQGTGKGIFARSFGHLFGPSYHQITTSDGLVGKFNSVLMNKCVIFADEAYYAGDKAAEGTLKALITEPALRIEPKGVDSFTVPNHLSVIMATNSEWAIPAGMSERRFACFEVSSEKAQDRAYFGSIQAQLERGGYQGLLRLLLCVDLGRLKARGFDPKVIPQTKALAEQKERSLRGADKFIWNWVFSTEEWPDAVVAEDLHEEYKRSDRHAEVFPRFAARLKRVLGLDHRRRVQRQYKDPVTGEVKTKRSSAYDLPLHEEAKARLRAAFGIGLYEPSAPARWEELCSVDEDGEVSDCAHVSLQYQRVPAGQNGVTHRI